MEVYQQNNYLTNPGRLSGKIGNGPVNILFEKLAVVISWRLPRLVGRRPSKLLPSA